MIQTKKRLDAAQARYEKNYENRLCKHTKVVSEGDGIFLRV